LADDLPNSSPKNGEKTFSRQFEIQIFARQNLRQLKFVHIFCCGGCRAALNAVQAVQSAVNQMAYQAQQNAQHLSQKQQASLNDLAAAQQVTHSAPFFFSNLALLSNIFRC
jgi:sarcosine oxidase delta subunit